MLISQILTGTERESTSVCTPQFSWMIPDEMALYRTTFDLHFECAVQRFLNTTGRALPTCFAAIVSITKSTRLAALHIDNGAKGALERASATGVEAFSIQPLQDVGSPALR